MLMCYPHHVITNQAWTEPSDQHDSSRHAVCSANTVAGDWTYTGTASVYTTKAVPLGAADRFDREVIDGQLYVP